MRLHQHNWINRSSLQSKWRHVKLDQTIRIGVTSMAGRPRLFDESAALDAGMQLFWRQGYEATSLMQLREAMGLSSASFYNAFGSKENLFERVVSHYVSRPGSVVSLARSGEHLPAGEALTRLLHYSIDEQYDESHPPGCLVALAATVGPSRENCHAGDIVARQRAQDRQVISDLTERAAVERALEPGVSAETVAMLLHTFILGMATQTCDGQTAHALHRAAGSLDRLWGHSPGT